jgi:hypothetical protein
VLGHVAEIDAEAAVPKYLAAFCVDRHESFLRVGRVTDDGQEVEAVAERDRCRAAANGNTPGQVLALD